MMTDPDEALTPPSGAVAAVPGSRSPADPGRGAGPEQPSRPAGLTPEEQMALYEEDLKENDWGHQPC